MKKLIVCGMALILAAATVFAGCASDTQPTEQQTAATRDSSSEKSEFQEQVETILREEKLRGVVRVSKDGELAAQAANGTLSVSDETKLTPNLQFAIGSVSKQFTAACIMLLQEKGKLSVDDTIDRWFPEYKYGDRISVKHLLTMRSGIRDYVNERESGDDVKKQYDLSEKATEKSNRKVTRDWIFARELNFDPGTEYRYSNSNFFLLAEIVEQLEDKPFAEVLRERFFEPLGMEDSGVAEELCHSKRLAPPNRKNKSFVEIEIPGYTFGDGGIITTAADMDLWLTSLREHTILSEESVKEMTTDYSPKKGHYGYGLMIASDGAWYHSGAVDSYIAHAYTDPKTGYNLFIVTNRSPMSKLDAAANRIKKLLREKE